MKVLLTGASGFVGSHVLRHLLTHTDWSITCPVSFRHKGLPARIASSVCDTDWAERVTTVHWDMRAPADPLTLHMLDGCDVIMNVASESHVDRSIADPAGFVQNNVALMLNVLEVARAISPRLLLQMSTDEVYGPAYGEHRHREWEPVIPSNPYSASKAAQEAIAVSYWRTFGVPTVITNCYDTQTRVMTEHGFKGYNELKVGDRVWTLDADENLILETVQRTVLMPGDGRMVRVRSTGVDQLVTRNHRMMIRRAVGSPRRWQGIEETTAESLLNLKGRVRIPRTGAWSGTTDPVFRPYDHIPADLGRSRKKLPDEMPTDQVAALFGWFISEGCTSGTTVRFGAGREAQQETIRELLEGIDGEPYINSRAVCIANEHLARLFNMSGSGAENKSIPQFIRDLDAKYLQPFLQAMIDGDGTWYGNGAVYYTKSWTLAQQMCEVGMKLGYAARISERETWNPRKTVKAKSYIVRLSPNAGEIERRNVTEEAYDGDVWCLSVPSGRVFVERNGVVSLSGQTMNILGEMQDGEKFLPMIIRSLRDGLPITVHTAPDGTPGSRFYLHARNLADAWLWLTRRYCETAAVQTLTGSAYSEPGPGPAMYADGATRPDRFHIVGEREVDNIELVHMVADIMGVESPQIEKVSFHQSRPGHDLRYALDGTRIADLGWAPPVPLEKSIETTVRWTLEHPEWLAL